MMLKCEACTVTMSREDQATGFVEARKDQRIKQNSTPDNRQKYRDSTSSVSNDAWN
jgi:hypothetical protein